MSDLARSLESPPRAPLVITGLLAVTFSAAAAWAYAWDSRVAGEPCEPRVPVAAEQADSTPVSSPTGTGLGVEFANGPLATPVAIPELLAERFLGPQERLQTLRHLLSGTAGVVTVINVWGSYCKPCLQEFRELREYVRDWGSKIRFVMIQTDRDEVPDLVAPEGALRVHDYNPNGAVLQRLVARDLLPRNAVIPLTLVLDCRHQLRWLHSGEIRDMAGFVAFITGLRDQLDGAPMCACGDNSCDAPRENCHTCPEDCRCTGGQKCQPVQGDREYICAGFQFE